MRDEAEAVSVVVLTTISVPIIIVVIVIMAVVVSIVVASVVVSVPIIVVVWCYSSYAGVLVMNGSILSIHRSFLVALCFLIDLFKYWVYNEVDEEGFHA